MKIQELSAAKGAKKAPKRIGRGTGSGIGKTSARGQKGQNSRSGGGVRPGFEGGQMPLSRRLPKRGFTNIFATEYAVIDLSVLNLFEDGTVVDLKTVMESGKAKKALSGLKVLGSGDINKKLTVRAKKFTKSAKEKIEAAGGSAEVV